MNDLEEYIFDVGFTISTRKSYLGMTSSSGSKSLERGRFTSGKFHA